MCLLLASQGLFAQGIRDSVFRIGGVEVTADPLFEKDHAGMRETLIDTAVLADKAMLTLSDLLAENSTVFIKDHGRGALATASFRGSAPSHTQVNWNGITLNSPMAGMVDFSLIPVFLVDRLSLRHGASSLSDGGGGIGGAIQIDNTAQWERGRGVQYLQGIGSYRTFDELLQAGLGNRTFRSETRVYHSYSRNNYPFENLAVGQLDPITGKIVHPVQTNDDAAFFRYGILQELYFRPGSGHLVSVRYWGQSAERTIPRPTSYEGPEVSNLNRQQDRDHRVVAQWNHDGANGHWMVRSGYSMKHLDFQQWSGVPGLGTIPVVSSRSVQQSSFNTVSYRYAPDRRWSLEGKIDLNYHDVSSGDSVTRQGYHQRRPEVAMLLAAGKDFEDRLNLRVMLRQDWIDGRWAPFSPYLGFDLRLIRGKELILKGHVARNYHAPSLNDLYWQPGGNPSLEPEQGWTGETGLEYGKVFEGVSGNPRIRTELTAYRSDIRQWIIWTPGFKGYWEPRNVARVLSTGLEYGITISAGHGDFGYRVNGSYAYTRTINYGDKAVWGERSYGKQLVYIPLHSGNLLIHLSFRNYFLSWQYNAYSERFTTSSNDLTRRSRLPPYFINHLSAGRSFSVGKFNLSAEMRIYNLFNESYQTILYRPMPGRHYHLVLLFKI